MKPSNQWWMLAIFIGICLGVGALGSALTYPDIPGWYAGIRKPSFTPPGAVFGPVWTFLYITMGIAAWLVWRTGPLSQTGPALRLFGIQLVLNLCWSLIFFRWHSPGGAFAEIIVLWVMIALTTRAFFKRSRAAGLLMLPYFAWVSFASVLNGTIWQMNS